MPKSTDSIRGVRILVVEDEVLIAEEIRDRLSRLGAEIVDVVDTGVAAQSACERLRPDLVLMDIRLKGEMTGIEAAEPIRRYLRIPVVFLTAHSDWETVLRAKKSDPFGYVLKPFQEGDLVATVKVALHRHTLEQQLTESERRFEATLSSIGEGVIAADATGRVTFLNAVAEALTGWPCLEAEGQAIEDVFSVRADGEEASPENPARRALQDRRVIQSLGGASLIARDGRQIPVDISAAPIMLPHGDEKLLGTVVAFRDVSERRRLEAQVLRAQKMEAMGRLAGGVAHDFNNLLTIILAQCETLLTDLSGQHPLFVSVATINDAAEKAASLTRQLLAFSRQSVLELKIVNLNEVVIESEKLLSRLIGEDIQVEVRLDPALSRVKADPVQLQQAIVNLVLNARDAMPDGGKLTIETSFVESEMTGLGYESNAGEPLVMLKVSDTGCGIAAADLPRIFEPFFTTKSSGTGLGLAVVHGVIKQSGGQIDVDTAVGNGTTAKILFPATQSIESPEARDAAGGPAPHGSETLLVVEDEEAVREIMKTSLEAMGYTVLAAASDDEAMEIAENHHWKIDLLVTDVVLGRRNGRQLADALREHNPNLKALFISGYTADVVLRRGVLQGEVEFLEKPFTPTLLGSKVRAVLDAR